MDTTTKAAELARMFETRKRDDGSEFVTLKDNAPEWASEFVQEAHGLDMLPDDYRYRWISEALDLLAENPDADPIELGHEFADNTSIYTFDLLNWLSSNLMRVGYCDEAAEDYGVADDADLTNRIALGQFKERAEVFAGVVANLPLIEQV